MALNENIEHRNSSIIPQTTTTKLDATYDGYALKVKTVITTAATSTNAREVVDQRWLPIYSIYYQLSIELCSFLEATLPKPMNSL
jgi:hypothetical protein